MAIGGVLRSDPESITCELWGLCEQLVELPDCRRDDFASCTHDQRTVPIQRYRLNNFFPIR